MILTPSPLHLPKHVRANGATRVVDDTIFFPKGHLFPESRDELHPHRRFPLHPKGLRGDDASLAEEIWGMGLLFNVFIQHHLETGFSLDLPPNWSRRQQLWSGLDVFDEEFGEWRQKEVQVGYDIEHLSGPDWLHPDQCAPRRIGFLPGGGVVVHWEIAELMSGRFEVEIEALPSSVDHRHLVLGRGLSPQALRSAPIGEGVETGILVSSLGEAQRAMAWIKERGGTPEHFSPNPEGESFFRLRLPVFQAEIRMNQYLDSCFEEIGARFSRLLGFRFCISDHPGTREEHLFSTEHGNLIISSELRAVIAEHYLAKGSGPPGEYLPIVRTP